MQNIDVDMLGKFGTAFIESCIGNMEIEQIYDSDTKTLATKMMYAIVRSGGSNKTTKCFNK